MAFNAISIKQWYYNRPVLHPLRNAMLVHFPIGCVLAPQPCRTKNLLTISFAVSQWTGLMNDMRREPNYIIKINIYVVREDKYFNLIPERI